MILTGENQRIWRTPFSIPNFYITTLTWTDLGPNPDLCGDGCLYDCKTNVNSYQAVVTYKNSVHTSQKTIMCIHNKEKSVHAHSNETHNILCEVQTKSMYKKGKCDMYSIMKTLPCKHNIAFLCTTVLQVSVNNAFTIILHH